VAAQSDGRSEMPDAAILCHELRSHLAAVSLGSSHLRRRLVSEDPELIRSLDIIDKSVGRATELTSWVLDATYEHEQPVIDLDSHADDASDKPDKPASPRVARPHLPPQGLPRDSEMRTQTA
jgi:hypothetical protein